MFLSVIIPIYNVENYIRECFDSILIQKFEDIEFICIDDGSTDSSGLICDEYAVKDKRFVVRHTANKGVAAARNLGLSIASGEYILWIDPDDYISENYFNVIVGTLASNKCDILIFDYIIEKNGKKIPKQYQSKAGFVDRWNFLNDIVDDQLIQSQLWQKVFCRKLFEGIAFPENVKCMEDYAILHKIIERTSNIFYINQPLYYYRVRNDGLVMEVDLEKSYSCYLVAKDRYEYLSCKYKNVSKVGYLCQALGFCIQFHKTSPNSKYHFEKEYRCLRNVIREHIVYILKNTKLTYKDKIKFLLVIFRIIGICVRLHNLRRS